MTQTSDDLCHDLLRAARRAGAETADAILVHGTAVSVDVRAGALEQANRSEGTDLGLRVLVGQRQANVSASDTSNLTDRQRITWRVGDLTRSIIENLVGSQAPDEDLARIADQLDEVVAGGYVADPTMEGAAITIRVEDADMEAAAKVFRNLATLAEDAIADEDRCRAAKVFQDMLGRTTDGEWIFEMPASCNDDGTNRTIGVVAGDRQVPAGDRRFA